LFGELWNFLGGLGRKLVLRKMLGTFVFGNITSPPPPPSTHEHFPEKKMFLRGPCLGRGAPIFEYPPPHHIPVGTALSVYTTITREYSLLNIKCLKN
jgi:hypothetical protein